MLNNKEGRENKEKETHILLGISGRTIVSLGLGSESEIVELKKKYSDMESKTGVRLVIDEIHEELSLNGTLRADTNLITKVYSHYIK